MLTVRAVESAKPREKAYKLADAQGLYLFVSPAGTKSWRANYVEAGKQKTRTYGQFPSLSLTDARKAHQRAREAPIVVSDTKPTFEVVARQWVAKHQPSLSNPKHKVQVENTLATYVYPSIGSRPIDQIQRKELAEVVQAIQRPGKADDRVETAHRVAGRITAVFDYAQDVGIVSAHPASHLSRVLISRKTKKAMPSIPPAEAGALLRAIAEYPEPVTSLGLQLLAHVFVRPGELRLMEWTELREDGAVWVIPEERMKLRLPHVVPLSAQAQAILKRLRAMTDSRYVLASPAIPDAPISENTLLFALYRMGYKDRMTAHGFRALASTVLNEQSGFAGEVIERQLAHKETDQVRAAYNRAEHLPARRELMNWWARWLDEAAAKR